MEPVVVFGEVLFDIFPEERCLGGAPFNFAFHLHRLGVSVLFVSRIGDDELGHEILQFLEKHDFPTKGIQIDPDRPTGEVQVFPNTFGGPRFEILRDQAYDYISEEMLSKLDSVRKTSMLYFGTLSQRNDVSKKSIQNIIKGTPKNSKIFLDLNLRAPFYDYGVLEYSLRSCNFLKLNEHELNEIQRIMGLQYYPGINPLIEHLYEEYCIERIFLTKGEKGFDFFKKGEPLPRSISAPGVDNFKNSVGAGDAFSAMTVFGILHQWPIEILLERASLFASKICSINGALTVEKEFYTPFLVDDA